WEAVGKDFRTEVDRLVKQPELLKILRASPSWKQIDAQLQDGRTARAKVDVKTLETAVAAWKVKYGKVPPTLEALTKPGPDGGLPFLQSAGLTAPWGRPYAYDPQNRNPQTDVPLIWSEGPIPRNPAGRITNWTP